MQEWKTVEPRRQKQIDKSHTERATTVKEGKYQTTNGFEVLSDTTDSEVNEIILNEIMKIEERPSNIGMANLASCQKATSTSSLTRSRTNKIKNENNNQHRHL